jgi:DUF4097 and DUF4098 domain-containing protein YvlB
MKYKLCVALISGSIALPVFADTEVNKTIDASPDGYVEVSNVAGEIEIVGWSRNAVKVEATLGDDVEELIFERDGDEVVIKVRVPRRHGRDIESDLKISVPEGSRLDVSGVSADIEIEDVFGEQSLATVSGDVVTEGVAADVEAASVSGDIEVTGSGKVTETEAATVSGDVTVTNVSGSVEVESVSGEVSIVDGEYERAYLETINGDLTFKGELVDGGKLGMESVNGSVEVILAGEVSARFDVETFNGSIKNCFGPKPERTSRYSPGLELSFTQGDGNGRVEIETLNGSVRICNE